MKLIYKDFQELYAVLRGKIVEVKPIERKKPEPAEEPKDEAAEEPKPKKKTSRKKKEE